MPKTNKNKDYSIQHCKERLQERYNIELNENDYVTLCNNARQKIKNNEIRGKEPKKGPVQNYFVELYYQNKPVICVFEVERDTITTFVPWRRN